MKQMILNPDNEQTPLSAGKSLFAIPDRKRYELFELIIDKNYTQATLREIAATFQPFLSLYRIEIKREPGIQRTFEPFFDKVYKLNKRTIIAGMATILADECNFKLFMASLPANVQKVWEQIICQGYISARNAGKLLTLSFPITNPNQINCWYIQRKNTFSYSYYEKSETILTLPSDLSALLIPYYFGEEQYRLKPYTELPEHENSLLRFNDETHISKDISLLYALHAQGLIKLNITDKITASTIKNVLKKLYLHEFFHSEDNQVNSIRGRLLVSVFCYFATTEKKNTWAEMVRDIFNSKIYNAPDKIIPLLLPHLTGLRTNVLKTSDESGKRLITLIKSCINNGGSNGWILMSNLFLHCRQEVIPLCPLTNYQLRDMKVTVDKDEVFFENLQQWITYPFITNFIFTMAAFGLVEIAYEPYEPEIHEFPCYTLRYFRFTQLGLYALNQTSEYKETVVIPDCVYFELDERNLIIRALQETNPYEGLLEDMATPIGNRRYQLSHASILKNCSTREDVTSKIAFFRKYVKEKVPSLWESFFSSLVQRCGSLKKPDVKYVVFQVDPQNKDFIRFISSDPLISKYCLKAENCLLLVDSRYLQIITEQLKSYGYLI